MGTTIEEVVTKAILEDNVSPVAKKASKQMAKFGDSAEVQRQVFSKLSSEADKNNVSIHKMLQAHEGLTSELESGADAAEHASKVLDIQLTTGINSTKKAAQALGDVLGGGTKLLRQYDDHAAKMADEIDKIQDPAKRAELALKEVERAIKRQNSTLTKAKNKLQEYKVRLAGLGPGFKAGAAGALAVGAAIGGVLAKAITTYMSKSAKMAGVQERLNAQLDEFMFQLGGAVVGATDAGSAIDVMSDALSFATDWVKKNQSQIGTWTKMVLRGGVFVAKVVGNIGLGIAALASLTVEGVGEMVRKSFGAIGDVGVHLVHVLEDVGIITFDTMKDFEGLFRTMEKGGRAQVHLPITQKIVELQGELNALADGFDDVLGKGGGVGKGGVGRRKRKGSGGGKAKPKLFGPPLPEDMKARQAEEAERQAVLANLKEVEARMDGQIGKLSLIDIQLRATAVSSQEAFRSDLIDRLGARYGAFINGPLQQLTSGWYKMADAIAAGNLAMKDIGVTTANIGADILGNLGLDLVGEAVGAFATYIGGVFVAMGGAFEALASNPFGLALAGGTVIAAGLLLRKYVGSGSITSPGAAQSADSATGASLERLGRDLFPDDRGDEITHLHLGNLDPIVAIARAASNSDRRRGRYQTDALYPGFALG